MARRSLLLLFALGATLLAPATAAALTGGDFGVTPAPKPGPPRAYFSFALSAGQTHRDAVVVSNASKATETLKVSPSTGTTAAGSGLAYRGAFSPCSGTGCWISGLPSTITLPAGKQVTIPFTVTVPAGTADQQYLAGITVRPAVLPKPTTLSSAGQASAQAVIVHEVNVGVAVTIGPLASLSSRLTVRSVTSTAVGTTPRLLINEQNTGQTFTHAQGTATCSWGGTSLTFDVESDTVLPGDHAQLVTNAPGLPPGKSVNCVVLLAYGNGQTASHTAAVKVPQVNKVTVVHTAPGVFAELPASPGIPTWAYVLIGLGAGVLLLLLVVAILLLRRRRSAPVAPPLAIAPTETPPEPADAPESNL